MTKDYLRVLRVDKNKKKIKKEKENLVKMEDIGHIATETLVIKSLVSDPNMAEIQFVWSDGRKEWEINFLLEIILDTLVVEFDGNNYHDDIRIKASQILEKLVESLRFRHRDKYWSLSHYYISDVANYEARKKKEYPQSKGDFWKKISTLFHFERMEDVDYLLFSLENNHELLLRISGEDGKILCDHLSDIGIAHYNKLAENEYEIVLIGDEVGHEAIHKKIVFAREAITLGYNIWVDYDD